jgi:hypothetical protein
MHNKYRQGDVLIIAVDTIPKNTTPVARENGRLILAHGEATGHAHAIDDDTCELVTAEGAAELYLLVHGTDPVELTHDEHDTIVLPPRESGGYQIVRQREYAPEEIRTVAD